MAKIVVIDYGMGNLRSVSKALERLGGSVTVSGDPKELAGAEKVVLPGVGAFGAAMRELNAQGLVEPIKAAIASGKPYLGICLGLQLLFRTSEEAAGTAGLGVLEGEVKRFEVNGASTDARLKIPHMGWNQVEAVGEAAAGRCPLLRGMEAGSFVYFVHSYYPRPADRSITALETDYGVRFASMVWRGNLYATQFHPEKSQAVGLTVLENFLRL